MSCIFFLHGTRRTGRQRIDELSICRRPRDVDCKWGGSQQPAHGGFPQRPLPPHAYGYQDSGTHRGIQDSCSTHQGISGGLCSLAQKFVDSPSHMFQQSLVQNVGGRTSQSLFLVVQYSSLSSVTCSVTFNETGGRTVILNFLPCSRWTSTSSQ